MNLPNKLTTLRVILVPFFVAALLLPEYFPNNELFGGNAVVWQYLALVIFIAASVTDALDGHIARKYNLITNFGKFMDPLADKLLVCSAMICLIDLKMIPSWIVVIIIAREFIISGFRLVASDNGVVIAASYWGKFKTVSQMLMIIVMIAMPKGDTGIWYMAGQILMYISLVLTIVSLVDYIVKNSEVLKEQD